ncbi:MAG: hypothetical protein AAB783_02350 [Patescibacteria group bacterium]
MVEKQHNPSKSNEPVGFSNCFSVADIVEDSALNVGAYQRQSLTYRDNRHYPKHSPLEWTENGPRLPQKLPMQFHTGLLRSY